RPALELAGAVLGVGRIIQKRRYDDHREGLCRRSVKGREARSGMIIPCLERKPLRTAKRYDFERFGKVRARVARQERLRPEGLDRIAKIAESMDRRQRSRYLESSEAIRQPPLFRR